MTKCVVKNLEKFIKRIIDIIGGLIGPVILIPITISIIIAKLILREKGPIFYSQKRIGKNGKIFKIYKYRSMVVDADERLETILNENKQLSEENIANIKNYMTILELQKSESLLEKLTLMNFHNL